MPGYYYSFKCDCIYKWKNEDDCSTLQWKKWTEKNNTLTNSYTITGVKKVVVTGSLPNNGLLCHEFGDILCVQELVYAFAPKPVDAITPAFRRGSHVQKLRYIKMKVFAVFCRATKFWSLGGKLSLMQCFLLFANTVLTCLFYSKSAFFPLDNL